MNRATATANVSQDRETFLRAIEKKALWLSTWTIHHANHLRPNVDGLKVGGHQASSASLVSIMTALYGAVLCPEDRVAVKPHASPVFHALQYLFGNQTREQLEKFRAFHGAQSYPSRTKDADDVDFSTGSVGLGVAMTSFAALVRDYVRLKNLGDAELQSGRMVAVAGDAELDEGNVFECLLEGWKHEVQNVWWIIDYNRQSLDMVIEDRLFQRIDSLFESMGWRVVTMKYGRRLEQVFARRGGEAIRQWIDTCPNSLFSSLVYRGGAGWREHLRRDLAGTGGIAEILDEHDDEALHALMTNLGGHDMPTILDAFEGATDARPTCFLAYTIKGYGLPFAGHKDNHAGLMSIEQMEAFRASMRVRAGHEWDFFEGAELGERTLAEFVASTALAGHPPRRYDAGIIPVAGHLTAPRAEQMSTQEGFGRILSDLARAGGELADRIVTTSPDVASSTNLGPWVNRRGVFDRHAKPQADAFVAENLATTQRWVASEKGQHIELGIAENNLFLLLAALGLSHSLFGERLLPIGTLYDPFISRGLDALNYACYQDARFLLVATPSGLTLAPEGGAHQSVLTTLIGMGQPGLVSFEPAYVDELAIIVRFALEHMQRPSGSAVYLRLSTRQLDQPSREIDDALERDIVSGAYWLVPPSPDAELAVVSSGVVTQEARQALEVLREDEPGAGLLVITSPDRCHAGWLAATNERACGAADARSPIERALAMLSPRAGLVSIVDAHPATLSWLGSVAGHRIVALGSDRFGQSADIVDLYRHHRLDVDAIVDAAARVCLEGL
ncbi:MAG TPA: 1-deoxy-D-xylulose-5-phosphate synthase N-terminal domain-containing protein [Candidatus Binatia bacterium]|nr:1-deoxy-D-xylulose-5-phosphate synthase N-terminal domain-containing protein [Candidatus Binatia bacterium]